MTIELQKNAIIDLKATYNRVEGKFTYFFRPVTYIQDIEFTWIQDILDLKFSMGDGPAYF